MPSKKVATKGPSPKASKPSIPPMYDLSSPHFNLRKYLKAGLDINASNKGGWTPMYFAQIREDWWAIGELIRRGASLAAPGGFTTPPAVALGANAPIWLLKLANSQGIDWNAHNWGGYTALMLAAMRGRTSNVRFLLEHGADPNMRGLGQSTALHACVSDEEDRREALAVARCMRLLVQHGASLDLKEERGLTPVDMALKIARKRSGLGWNDPRLKELGIEPPKSSPKSRAKKTRR